MKKSLLISASVLVGLTASASQPVNGELTKAFDISEQVLVYQNTAQPKAINIKKSPLKVASSENGDYTFYPLMVMPSVPFYMGGLTYTDSKTGEVMHVAPYPVPLHTPQEYVAQCYYTRKTASTPQLDNSKFKFGWKYLDFNDIENKTADGKSLSLTYPSNPILGGKVLPKMWMDYEEVNDTAAEPPYELILGGSGVYPLASGVQQVGFNTCAMINDMSQYKSTSTQWESCGECKWGSTVYNGTTTTFTQGSLDRIKNVWADDFKSATNQTLQSVRINGVGYNLPYAGAPYLLKNLTMVGWGRVTAETTFYVDVYEADAKGNMIGEPLYKKTCTIVPTKNEQAGYSYGVQVSTNFTSKDADGFDLDYVVVDKPLFVKVYGFIDNPAVENFSPWAGGYLASTIDGSNRTNHYNYGRVLPYTACNIVDLVGDGGAEVKNLQSYFDTYIYGTDTQYYSYHNFYVQVDAEYPYLEPYSISIDNKNTQVAYASDGKYNFEVPTGTNTLTLNINTSSSELDEVVIDDLELPTGVKATVIDGIEAVQSGRTYNFIGLQLEFDSSFVNKSFNIPVMYKNLSMNLNFYNGNSSVGELEVDNNAAPVYYDLQGRKVVGTPDKGVYIVKQGNKVNKVIL